MSIELNGRGPELNGHLTIGNTPYPAFRPVSVTRYV